MGEVEDAGLWREKDLERGKGRNFLFGERESGEKVGEQEWKCVEISEEAAIWLFSLGQLLREECPVRVLLLFISKQIV